MSDANGVANSEENQELAEADSEPDAAAQAGAEAPARETGDTETELEAVRAKADENWNLYLRAVADNDNIRKRAARDLENAHKFGLEKFATELLGVKDSMEMGLEAAATADAESLRAGIETTLKLLDKTLAKFNIVELDPEGEPFDPDLHEAMAVQESDKVEPDTVLQVVQKGYTLNDRLLRAARVFVAKAPETQEKQG